MADNPIDDPNTVLMPWGFVSTGSPSGPSSSTASPSPSTVAPSPSSQNAEEPPAIEVATADGRYIVNGHSMSLLSALFYVLHDRVGSLDQSIGGMLDDMNGSNQKAKGGQILEDYLRAHSKGFNYKDFETEGVLEKIKSEYGMEDPATEFGVGNILNSKMEGKHIGGTQVGQMIETVKSHISSLSNTQQMQQFDLERFNNERNEVTQLMSSFLKSVNDLLNSMARSLS